MKTLKMNQGLEIPCIGFGTYNLPDDSTTVDLVKEAIKMGYRLFDCGPSYQNQRSIGQGIKESGIDRSEIFVTSKSRNAQRSHDRIIEGCNQVLEELGLDYLDLYLIHWPASFKDYENWKEINIDTWSGMIDLYKMGKVKSIGVSNFYPHHLEPLVHSEIIPMINQIEFHPGQINKDVVDYCRSYGIIIEAHTPLGSGEMLKNEKLIEIANKYQKTVAQLCLRWALQNGTIPIPKSSSIKRLKENIDIFDFEINESDMKSINEMDYFAGTGLHPDKIDF